MQIWLSRVHTNKHELLLSLSSLPVRSHLRWAVDKIRTVHFEQHTLTCYHLHDKRETKKKLVLSTELIR